MARTTISQILHAQALTLMAMLVSGVKPRDSLIKVINLAVRPVISCLCDKKQRIATAAMVSRIQILVLAAHAVRMPFLCRTGANSTAVVLLRRFVCELWLQYDGNNKLPWFADAALLYLIDTS